MTKVYFFLSEKHNQFCFSMSCDAFKICNIFAWEDLVLRIVQNRGQQFDVYTGSRNVRNAAE